MKKLKNSQQELKSDLEVIFHSVTTIAERVKKYESEYNGLLSSYISSLEVLSNKDLFRKKITSFFTLTEKFVAKTPQFGLLCNDILERSSVMISTYEKMETNLIFSSLQNMNEGHKKIRNIIKELNFLYQYDDIISQSFQSYEQMLGVVEKIESGDIKVNKNQVLKLKILYSSVIVSIFDMLEDTLSMIDNKLFRIASIFKNSRNYVKTIVEIFKKENYEFFDHVNSITVMCETIPDNEKDTLLFDIKPAMLAANWKFLDEFYTRLYDIIGELKVVNLDINVLLNKTMLENIISAIDMIFEGIFVNADESAIDIDFCSALMKEFKIKEHKEILINIFEPKGERVEDVLDDGIEFF